MSPWSSCMNYGGLVHTCSSTFLVVSLCAVFYGLNRYRRVPLFGLIWLIKECMWQRVYRLERNKPRQRSVTRDKSVQSSVFISSLHSTLCGSDCMKSVNTINFPFLPKIQMNGKFPVQVFFFMWRLHFLLTRPLTRFHEFSRASRPDGVHRNVAQLQSLRGRADVVRLFEVEWRWGGRRGKSTFCVFTERNVISEGRDCSLLPHMLKHVSVFYVFDKNIEVMPWKNYF